jgi:hypothetical protein
MSLMMMMMMMMNGVGAAHINILYPGDVTVFPRGQLHFEINIGKVTASYLSALNSQNPGTLVLFSLLLNHQILSSPCSFLSLVYLFVLKE